MSISLKTSKLLALALTLLLLFMNAAFWHSTRSNTQSQIDKEFHLASQDVSHQIEHHFLHWQTLLQQAQAIHIAAPGIDGTHLQRFVAAQLQRENLSGAARAVVFAADRNGQPHMAGTDDMRLLQALHRSAETGQPQLSERLQPADGGPPAYALVAPLYAQGEVPAGQARKLDGWVCMVFEARTLLGLLATDIPSELGYDIYDSQAPAAAALVYRSVQDAEFAGLQVANQWLPQQHMEHGITVGDTRWTVQTYPRTAFADKFNLDQASWMALLGISASLLIGSMVWALGNSREHAMQLVQTYTHDLQNSNADLNAVLEAIPDLLFELDSDGRYRRWWSPRTDLLAAPPEVFLGKRIDDVLPPEASAICHAVMRECQHNGYSSGHQIWLDIGGERKWFELSASRKDAGSDTPLFIILSRDITERKRTELAVADREQQLQLALHGGDLGFWDWDFASGTLQVNTRWYTMLGLDPAHTPATIGLWDSLVHPADHQKLDDLVQQVLLQPEGVEFSVEVRARHAQGHYVWILDKGAVVSRDEQGRPLRVVGTHMDVTASKADEQRLRLNEYAFKAITQGICITDLQGDVTSVNDAFCDITGYSQSEIIGQNCRILQGSSTDRDTVRAIRTALKSNTTFNGEILNYRKDGQSFWNDLQIAPVVSSDQTVTHFVGVIKDISYKKRTELILAVERNGIRMTTEKLRTLSRRVLEVQETERRRVAHELHDELGQSLTAIKINLLTNQSRTGHPPTPLDLENVRIVEDALQQVRRIALALRPSMLDDLGLKAALAWLSKAASVNQDFEVEFHCSMDQSRLPGNVETACFRIVQEALTNVRRHAQASKVHVHLNVQAGQLQLRIADDGIGYAAPAGEESPGERSLGLLGMRERAASIGGTITLHSALHQGTTVELQCSLSEPEATTA